MWERTTITGKFSSHYHPPYKKKGVETSMTLNGYKYHFTDDFIYTCYDDTVNKYVEEHLGGKLTLKDCEQMLTILGNEPYEKWWTVIDTFVYFEHFMKENEVDYVTIIGKGYGLWD